MPVAVAVPLVLRNPTLTARSSRALSRLRSSTTPTASLAGDELVEFLRGHREGDHRPRRPRRARISRRAGTAGGQQVRRRPRHDRSRRRARAAASRVRWTPGVNRQAVAELTIAFMHRAVPQRRAAGARDCATAAGASPAAASSRPPSSASSAAAHVGQQVARLCRAFGATVLAHDIRVYDEFYRDAGVDAGGARRAARAVRHRHDPPAARCVDARLDRRARARADEADGVSRQHRARRRSSTKRRSKAALRRAAPRRRRVRRVRGGAASRPRAAALPNFVGTPHIGGGTAEAALAMGRAAIAGLDGGGDSIDPTSNP